MSPVMKYNSYLYNKDADNYTSAQKTTTTTWMCKNITLIINLLGHRSGKL